MVTAKLLAVASFTVNNTHNYNLNSMRITVEIEGNKMDAIRKWTGQRKKSPAIAQALDAFLEQQQRQAFLDRVMEGQTDYHASNDEVELLADLEQP
jgi:hypothetical protein